MLCSWVELVKLFEMLVLVLLLFELLLLLS